MRKYIFLFAIVSLFVIGCSEETLVSPNPSSVKSDYQLIKLPNSFRITNK